MEEDQRYIIRRGEEEEQKGDGGDGELREGEAQEEAQSLRGSGHLVQEDHVALAKHWHIRVLVVGVASPAPARGGGGAITGGGGDGECARCWFEK